jgi:hypothetical protein
MKALYIAAAAALLTLLPAVRAAAGDLSVSVDPMVFEFTAGYGGTQQATVQVTNSGDAAEQISIRPVDWRVAHNGSVAIENAGAEGARSLTGYLKVTPSLFSLARGETRTITVALQMPDQAAHRPATLWGGFLLSASNGKNGAMHAGATMFVYNTSSNDDARLTLRSLSVRKNTVVAHIANLSDTYARPIVHIVLKKGDTVVTDRVVPVNAFLPGDDRVVEAPLPAAPRGSYQVHLVVDYGDALLDGATNVRLP